jgi:sulfate adenylyltransferase large subunit
MPGLLRICTAGNVDDGKSTLIGRLLYDSRSVYEDQVRSVRAASRNRTAGPIDFSLFTDGLRAEREQGITIDVAYRYFATARRSFILADTPGHEQYTRNMATGASTADVAVLLVDARHGIRDQTRRHARIARLLGISTFVLAINKMDLVGFDRDVFDAVRRDLPDVLAGADVQAIPISALDGDNVIAPSGRTAWYDGPALLPFLETADAGAGATAAPFRFPVQLVIRPDHAFRGYAGQIASGQIAVGDDVTVWPSGNTTRVARIVTWDGDLTAASAPASVTLVLADDIDVGRGDTIARGAQGAQGAQVAQVADGLWVGRRFTAHVVWMDERPLQAGRPYVLKHGTRTVTAESADGLSLNQIGTVTITAGRPLVFEPYAVNRTTGSFILIDPATNFTAGAGMIAEALPDRTAGVAPGTAERLAAAARLAGSEADAIAAVRRLLDEVLA